MIPARWTNVEDWMRIVARDVNTLIQGALSVLTKTAAYTIEDKDDVILGDATVAAFTVILPPADLYEGRTFVVKKIDVSANAVTIDANAAETIDGALTQVLAAQWAFKRMVSNGTGWFTV